MYLYSLIRLTYLYHVTVFRAGLHEEFAFIGNLGIAGRLLKLRGMLTDADVPVFIFWSVP